MSGTHRGFSIPLAKGRERKIAVRLLGGVLMWVTSLYCEPKRGLFRKANDHAVGLHIELAQFGFGKKVSPGLETRIARPRPSSGQWRDRKQYPPKVPRSTRTEKIEHEIERQ